MSGGRAIRFEYCCWKERRQAGERPALSIAAAAAGGKMRTGVSLLDAAACVAPRHWLRYSFCRRAVAGAICGFVCRAVVAGAIRGRVL